MTRSRRLLISTCVLAAALAAQAPPTSPMELVDVALPSESAAVGGTLALRLLAPRTGRAFFPEGAPVVVHVPGGFELGGLA